VLLKALAQAIPAYAMPVFNIPKNICKGITDVISQFWWVKIINETKCTGSPDENYVFLRIEDD
jgi:hypothetical protein